MCEVFRCARCGDRRRVAGHSSRRPDRHIKHEDRSEGVDATARTDGHPDLSGVWSHNAATPFERPKELEGREFLTEQEVANLKANAAELFNGDTDAAFGDSVFLAALRRTTSSSRPTATGNYNHFWLVDREFDNRTSLISDPEGRPASGADRETRRRRRRRRRAPQAASVRRSGGHRPLPALHHRQRADVRRRLQQLLPDRPVAGLCRRSTWKCGTTRA